MKEEDLIPFDWEAYKAGAEAYEDHGDYGWQKIDFPLIKVERRSGCIHYEDIMRDQWDISQLRLLKPKEEIHIGSTLDSFLEEEGILEECENAAKDSLIMRGDK